MLIVTITLGEVFIYLSIKSREKEQYELISSELTLFQLIKNAIQTGFELNRNKKNIKRFLRKKFFQIHNRDNYQDELKDAANLLFFGQELSHDYAQMIYDLENQFHKGNIVEMDICLKNQLGTNETSKQFYGLVKPQGFFSKIIPKQVTSKIHKLNNLIKSRTALRLGFLLNVTLRTIVYYLDLVKDVFLIVSISSFVPFSNTKFESFEIQVVFMLCLSIILAILSNTFLILFDNSILILQSCKVRLVFALISVVSPSVSQYIIQRLNFQQKILNNNFIENPNSNTRRVIQDMNFFKHMKW
jgi:hypothetical protein